MKLKIPWHQQGVTHNRVSTSDSFLEKLDQRCTNNLIVLYSTPLTAFSLTSTNLSLKIRFREMILANKIVYKQFSNTIWSSKFFSTDLKILISSRLWNLNLDFHIVLAPICHQGTHFEWGNIFFSIIINYWDW